MQELYATIAALPEDRRLALVAVDVLGLSYREAARALRVREATITTRLFRARKQVDTAARPLQDPPAGRLRGATAGRFRARAPRSAPREETRASGVLPSRGTS